jgi:hypothetical protein
MRNAVVLFIHAQDTVAIVVVAVLDAEVDLFIHAIVPDAI